MYVHWLYAHDYMYMYHVYDSCTKSHTCLSGVHTPKKDALYIHIYLLCIAEQATHGTPIVGEGNFCQKAEGKFVKGAGALANPGGAAGCVKGGKCMFKFAKCTKCGRGEAGIKVP